jgi:hypothetical protein
MEILRALGKALVWSPAISLLIVAGGLVLTAPMLVAVVFGQQEVTAWLVVVQLLWISTITVFFIILE